MPDQVFTQSEIEVWRKEESPNLALVKEYRRYLRNDHPKTMTAAQQRALGRRGKYPIADNVLKLIIRTTAARVRLLGFSVADDTVTEFLADFWVKNNLDAVQYKTAFAALRDGNHAISLRWGSDRVIAHRERWWDGTSGVFVAYDDYEEPLFAVKDWTEKDKDGRPVDRRTVYYPDEIHRLRRTGSGWEPFVLASDPETERPGILPWVKSSGDPLGIPVIHFANNLESDDVYGVSDIAGLLGLQDDLNSIQRDITAASGFTAFQQYVFTGVDPNEMEDVEVAPGMIYKLQNASGRGAVLPAGSTANLTAAHSYKRQTMAVDTSTPMHSIAGGDWPSGAALLRAEQPLVDKVIGLHSVFGPAWTTVAHRSTEMMNAFSPITLNENALISTRWDDAERLDELTRIQIDKERAELWSLISTITSRTILQQLGILTDAQIDLILAEQGLTEIEEPGEGEAGDTGVF